VRVVEDVFLALKNIFGKLFEFFGIFFDFGVGIEQEPAEGL